MSRTRIFLLPFAFFSVAAALAEPIIPPVLKPDQVFPPDGEGVRACGTLLRRALDFREVYIQSDSYARVSRLATTDATTTAFLFQIYQDRPGAFGKNSKFRLNIVCEIPQSLADCWKTLQWDKLALPDNGRIPWKRMPYENNVGRRGSQELHLSGQVPNTYWVGECLRNNGWGLEPPKPPVNPPVVVVPPPVVPPPAKIPVAPPPAKVPAPEVRTCFSPDLIEVSLFYDPEKRPEHAGISLGNLVVSAKELTDADPKTVWPPMRAVPPPLAINVDMLGAKHPKLWQKPELKITFHDDVPPFDFVFGSTPQKFPGAKGGESVSIPAGEGNDGHAEAFELSAPEGGVLPLPRIRSVQFCGVVRDPKPEPDAPWEETVAMRLRETPTRDLKTALAMLGPDAAPKIELVPDDTLRVVGERDAFSTRDCPALGLKKSFEFVTSPILGTTTFGFTSTARQKATVTLDGLCKVGLADGSGSLVLRRPQGPDLASVALARGVSMAKLKVELDVGRYVLEVRAKNKSDRFPTKFAFRSLGVAAD